MAEWGKYLKESEKQTAEKTVDVLLAGSLFSISVNDGEETTLRNSTDKAAILGALGTTGEDRLYVHLHQTPKVRFGWVWFVWGNEDWVAICDHTTNLENDLKPVFDWMEEQGDAAEWNLMHPKQAKQ